MKIFLAIASALRDDSQSFFDAYYRRGSRRILRYYFSIKDKSNVFLRFNNGGWGEKILSPIIWLGHISYLNLSAIIVAIVWTAWMTLPLFISFLIYLGDEL